MAEKIDFHFNVKNRIHYACRVVRKALSLKMRVAVWCSDAHRLDFFSRQLCSFEPTGFYPHVNAEDRLAAQTPVVSHTDAALLPSRDVLLLLDDAVPANYQELFTRFGRVIDVVGDTENERVSARERFVTYRRAGLSPVAHDQAKGN